MERVIFVPREIISLFVLLLFYSARKDFVVGVAFAHFAEQWSMFPVERKDHLRNQELLVRVFIGKLHFSNCPSDWSILANFCFAHG